MVEPTRVSPPLPSGVPRWKDGGREAGPEQPEDAALVLLFSLVASGQIKLRKLDGFRRIADVLSLRIHRAA